MSTSLILSDNWNDLGVLSFVSVIRSLRGERGHYGPVKHVFAGPSVYASL